MSVGRDMRVYGWDFCKSVRVNFWWTVEHLGYYRGGEGGAFGYVRRLGYGRRKEVERS